MVRQVKDFLAVGALLAILQVALSISVHAQSKDLEWHEKSPAGILYETTVSIDASCRVIVPPAGCTLDREHAVSISGDNTPFHRWDITYSVPGSVYYTQCIVNDHKLLLSEGHGNNDRAHVATCTGLINGDSQPVTMTVRWKQQW